MGPLRRRNGGKAGAPSWIRGTRRSHEAAGFEGWGARTPERAAAERRELPALRRIGGLLAELPRVTEPTCHHSLKTAKIAGDLSEIPETAGPTVTGNKGEQVDRTGV